MASQASATSTTGATTRDASSAPFISPSLKFVISNLKFLVPHSLSPDNFPIWSTQIAKLLKANGFAAFLDPKSTQENADPNQDAQSWQVTDQNLATALCSTISPEVLPYVIHLESTHEIWQTLQTRFQSSNRSKVIQLKNELHNVSMQTMSMTQYLTEIKKIVDKISAAGSSVDPEDVIIYILNGLPPAYLSFATTIRTMQNSLSLDNVYSLLISEEIHLKSAALKFPKMADNQSALFSFRGRGKRGRGRSAPDTSQTNKSVQNASITCQICKKKGHGADACWHQLNVNYVPNQPSSKPNNAFLANNDSNQTVDWYIDSGASSHMTNQVDNLESYNTYKGHDTVTIGDGRSVPIAHMGTGLLPTTASKLLLSQILHIPSLSYNLLSISNLVKDNPISIKFEENGFVFKDRTTKQVILKGPCSNGMYKIGTQRQQQPSQALLVSKTSSLDWQRRLGHPHHSVLQQISKTNPTLHIQYVKTVCTSCLSCKGHKLSFDRSSNKTTIPLELIHSDVWGPSPIPSHQGFKYYVIFVDDFSRYIWLFLLMHKFEVTNIFIQFVHFIERQTKYKVQTVRIDGGGEFVNHHFQSFTKSTGIKHQISCPYTPEQNGTAERKHRHKITTTRTLLQTAGLTMNYWLDAACTATYLINQLPSVTTENISPLQRMFQIKPSYQHLRTFGCECYPLSPPIHRTKLTPTSQPCIFLGYSEVSKGYKCLNMVTNNISISRHVKFIKNVFPCKNRSSHESLVPASTLNTTHPSSSVHHNSQPPRETVSQANTPSSICLNSCYLNELYLCNLCSFDDSKPPTATHQMITRRKTGNLKPVQRMNLLHQDLPHTDPTTYNEACKKFKWRKAMTEEFFALQKQGTWTLVPPPINRSILGSKWTYRTKYNSDGSIALFKARLVAQGNQQEYGLDYQDTFSPVAKLPTVRILFTVALYHQWTIRQLDVANAFLHGDINDTVYMRQPKGFEDSSNPNYVCCLKKAIYGLRQAPRQWYTTFTNYLIQIGFSHSQADPSLLILQRRHVQIYLLVYVDDILLTGNDTTAMNELVAQMKSRFTMNDLGSANHFLGIKIESTPDKYFLSQNLYANSIIQLAELQNCNSVANPSFTKTPVSGSDDTLAFDDLTYRKIIGSLQYLTLTRPDISYAVNTLSQHMHNPAPIHTVMLKKLIRYIKGSATYGLPISRSNLLLRTFSDADWASDPITRKSTSGFCTYLGDTLVSWTVKKQPTVSRSSTESEYRALASATADTIWIKRLLADFRITHNQPIDIFCDNMSTIALANNPVFHARTKHIEIDQRFVRDHIQNGSIRLLPISTVDQIADILTKPLATSRFKLLRDKLTIGPNTKFEWEC
ncbi:Retrovirus-related Pol polyprotein from transposon TNT 1-94 [Dendrobium catenatum]|uniref:Retrovirus-related Pol polyprotein from transposon TNT 1-94 n=1 Tax=Dendrobium catenatum TaxID=906689 RepID=A0A2I0VX92_9ASPA|nr:Retrovirus-related Pol polyprotein from transposon TNT 1-94 [Dendrobium catenatum]